MSSNIVFPDVVMVKVEDLQIDPVYQRDTKRVRSQEMADNLDGYLFDPVLVAEHNGELFVVDGGHRAMAAKLAGVRYIPAIVKVEDTPPEEAANLFSKKNAGQKSLRADEQFKADVVAGYTDAVDIDHAFRTYGWTLRRDIDCVGALRRGYKRYGPEATSRALKVSRSVILSGDKAGAWLMGGTIAVIGTFPDLDEKRLTETLIRYYVHIRRDMVTLGGNRPAASAQTMVRYYNKGLRPDSGRYLDGSCFTRS